MEFNTTESFVHDERRSIERVVFWVLSTDAGVPVQSSIWFSSLRLCRGISRERQLENRVSEVIMEGTTTYIYGKLASGNSLWLEDLTAERRRAAIIMKGEHAGYE
jgi:hypothetical protein